MLIHQVIFSGTKKQLISFSNPDNSKFNDTVNINNAGIIKVNDKVTAATIAQNFLLGMFDSVQNKPHK